MWDFPYTTKIGVLRILERCRWSCTWPIEVRITPNMTNEEAQEEEREVLASIYESDENFTQLSPSSFSYKVGEQGHPQSFVIEVRWGEGYPDEPPQLSLDSFYNKHLSEECKKAIVKALAREAEVLLGSPMTYSLIQHAQDNAEELVDASPTEPTVEVEEVEGKVKEVAEESGKRERKEVLTKRAKRKMAERTNAQGERPRGWDWVDVVKLSKTGYQLS